MPNILYTVEEKNINKESCIFILDQFHDHDKVDKVHIMDTAT